MAREGIGLALCILGVMGGNSQDFVLPAIIIAIGAILLLTGKEH